LRQRGCLRRGGFLRQGRGGLGRAAGAAVALQLVKPVLGSVGLSAEADGAAAETENFCQRQIVACSLAERLQSMEAEADDFGGEAEFVLGFRMVAGEHLRRRVVGGGQITAGAGKKEHGEAGQDRVQNGAREHGGEGHGRMP
jgi:hypothetical protein